MKQILLAGTALVGAAVFSAPASAELKLDLGGHFKGYAVYADDDSVSGDAKDYGIRKDTEIHFSGETTLDNGLTVGVHVEQSVENNDSNQESYAYFSGGWGRVNFGNEDGAAYLLQVAAPSADSNVDGLRTSIQGFNFISDTTAGGFGPYGLDYDHAHFGNGNSEDGSHYSTDRLTYLTPKFNGFQGGISYAPKVSNSRGIEAMEVPDFENLWEIAARWDGEFNGFGISFGGGYSTSENPTSGGREPEGWNTGLSISWNQFSLGGAYLSEDEIYTDDIETTTWVVGAAWDNGPYHVGASYLARKDEVPTFGDQDSWKAAIGAGYAFGPGMTFRGAVAFGEAANAETAAGVLTAVETTDFTQVTLGTDISF